MLPAARREGLRAIRGEEHNGRAAGAGPQNPADWSDGHAGDTARNACRRRSGEEEFIILAAVKSLLQSCGQGRGAVDGQYRRVDLRGDAGRRAEMGEIAREAVTEIDGCRCFGMAQEKKSLRDARLWIEMRRERFH